MILKVHVKPNSKTDQVLIGPDGTIRVKIKAPPVDGKANKYLVEFLSVFFDVPRSYIQVKKGETSPHKTIEINSPEENIQQKLKNAEKH